MAQINPTAETTKPEPVRAPASCGAADYLWPARMFSLAPPLTWLACLLVMVFFASVFIGFFGAMVCSRKGKGNGLTSPGNGNAKWRHP